MGTYNNAEEFGRALGERLKAHEKALFLAASTTHAAQLDRIFNEGKKSDGSPIGTYSAKPMLATKDQFRKTSAFKATQIESQEISYTKKGKVRKGKKSKKDMYIAFPNKKTGKKNKAVPVMFLEDGYKQLRQIQGYESSFVNLKYEGRLQSSYRSGLRPISKAEYSAGINNQFDAKKVGWMEEKYGKIFHLTKEERELFYKTYQDELNNNNK